MRFVMYGFKDYIPEEVVRTWTVNRMLARNRRPLMRNFVEWNLHRFGSLSSNPTLPAKQHLFDWLEQTHGIDTGFVFASTLMSVAMNHVTQPWQFGWPATYNPLSDDPVDLMNALSDHGHEFGKWSAAYLRRQAEQPMPAIFFAEATDAVLFRLHYGENTEIC